MAPSIRLLRATGAAAPCAACAASSTPSCASATSAPRGTDHGSGGVHTFINSAMPLQLLWRRGWPPAAQFFWSRIGEIESLPGGDLAADFCPARRSAAKRRVARWPIFCSPQVAARKPWPRLIWRPIRPSRRRSRSCCRSSLTRSNISGMAGRRGHPGSTPSDVLRSGGGPRGGISKTTTRVSSGLPGWRCWTRDGSSEGLPPARAGQVRTGRRAGGARHRGHAEG